MDNDKRADLSASPEKAGEELPMDELDSVTGAGNPFDAAPRVPEHGIDDNLRENG